MPLVRYFTVVGSLLLALLFLADWYFPKLIAAPATAGVDKSIIRLHSAHRWPEATVYDTSLPTIVPPPAPSMFAERRPPLPAAQPEAPTQAFAMAIKDTPATGAEHLKSARKQPGKRRTRVASAHIPHLASYEIGFRTAVPAGW